MKHLPLVVISFYDRRSLAPLEALLDSLDEHPAGAPHQRVICVNAGGGPALPARVVQRVYGILVRDNDGMNIGAWDAGWRRWPGRPTYVFVQDECRAVACGWLSAYLSALDAPGVGLVGECLNPSWDAPWAALREGPGRSLLPEHSLDGRPANRVDVYLAAMARFGIEPGPTGRHLRSLVWATTGSVLQRIGGFPHGRDYGECIGAEIGVSRAVEACGLSIAQVARTPFHFFRHREWNQDVAGGPFTHRPVCLEELAARGEDVPRSRAEARTAERGARTRARRLWSRLVGSGA